jgi:hypothetical protein
MEFRGEGECHHEIGNREQGSLLFFKPFLSMTLLTLGTMPILTGVILIVDGLTGIALIDMPAECGSATVSDVV